MPQQNYEDYWKLTLEYTDYNDVKFLKTLQMVVDKIDELNAGGTYVYNSDDNKALQQAVLKEFLKGIGVSEKNRLGSTRKAINQCIKLGFVNPKYQSYHPNTKEYLKAKTNKKRETLLSKIVYSNAKFNSSVTREHNWSQINFLLKTLEEVGKLNKKDLIALMTIDISKITENFVTRKELDLYKSKISQTKFDNRKYNQIGYLNILLKKLDDVVFVKKDKNFELYFEEDAKRIFGEDIDESSTKRDSYLHRLYKNQLQDECEEIYGNPMCVLEHLSYPVLIASHIKPFIESDENEAYDPNNGLLLSRTIDSLFDLKYISFTNDGTMLFSNRISEDVKDFWKDYKLENSILNEKRKEYLAYHRNLMTAIDTRV